MEHTYSLSCVAVENLGCWAGPVPVGTGEMTRSSLRQRAGIPFCVSCWQEKPPAVPWMDAHTFSKSVTELKKLPPFLPCSMPNSRLCCMQVQVLVGAFPEATLPARQGPLLLLWELELGR